MANVEAVKLLPNLEEEDAENDIDELVVSDYEMDEPEKMSQSESGATKKEIIGNTHERTIRAALQCCRIKKNGSSNRRKSWIFEL